MFTNEEEREVNAEEAKEFLDEFLSSQASSEIADDIRQKLEHVQTSLNECEDFAEDYKTCFRIHKLFCRVAISAPELGNAALAVHQRIGSFLLNKVSSEYKGIVLAFDSITIPATTSLMWDLPHIILPLHLRVLVFGPLPGTNLLAKFSKTQHDHYSLLSLGVFNVSVPLNDDTDTLSSARQGQKFTVIVDHIDSSSTPIIIRAKSTIQQQSS